MIRLATFAILFAVVYSYGVPQAPPAPPQYNPAPAPQYAPPPPPPPQYRPVPYYPVYWWNPYYYYDSWESWEDDDRHHHHHHHSGDHRPSCRNLRTDCSNQIPDKCHAPRISYYYEKSCKKAVITCGMGKMMLMTGDNEILAAGLGAQKVATCRGNGGWRAENVDGRMIDFDTVRCVTMAR